MTRAELLPLARSVFKAVDKANSRSIEAAVTPLRAVVRPNMHVGKGLLTEDETLEWYLGQILDIVDSNAWYAVNSWLNLYEKFVGEPYPREAK